MDRHIAIHLERSPSRKEKAIALVQINPSSKKRSPENFFIQTNLTSCLPYKCVTPNVSLGKLLYRELVFKSSYRDYTADAQTLYAV
ncbi:hypothetical protein [Nodularia sp. NIES-3585]|uniref:hypothetical protein n=1 Tax=Nodularia sp. NIES-3585 TaxID=1973477 RepID=UPI0011323C80|nr:hypothetical protein [Nodularia sp. NIES-3585]